MPAIVDPEPLIGVFADDLFNHRCDPGSIDPEIPLVVSGSQHLDGWAAAKCVFFAGRIPWSEGREDDRIGGQRQRSHSCCRARKLAEERNKDAFLGKGVQVRKNTEDPSPFQRAHASQAGKLFADLLISKLCAHRMNHLFDQGIINGAREEAQWIPECRVGERKKLPRSQVSGDKQNAPAELFRRFEALHAFRVIVNNLAKAFGCGFWKVAELAKLAPEVVEAAAQDPKPRRAVHLREGD